MNYFFGGGLEHVRDKAARRRKYRRNTANAENKEDGINFVSCVQPVNTDADIASTKSCSAVWVYVILNAENVF